MNMDKLEIYETRKISANELLKEKPTQLPFLQPIEDEPNNFNMNVNRVVIHDVRKHKIVYGENFVIIKFYNSENKSVANLSVFGSNENKEDEYLFIRDGSIISETSMRIMNGIKDGIY